MKDLQIFLHLEHFYAKLGTFWQKTLEGGKKFFARFARDIILHAPRAKKCSSSKNMLFLNFFAPLYR